MHSRRIVRLKELGSYLDGSVRIHMLVEGSRWVVPSAFGLWHPFEDTMAVSLVLRIVVCVSIVLKCIRFEGATHYHVAVRTCPSVEGHLH